MADQLAFRRKELPAPLLPIGRYRFRFLERTGAKGGLLAYAGYLGSAWRGAFGHALRKAVCVTRLPDCDACMLLQSCIYPWLFESRTPPDARKLARYPRTPGPFVLQPSDPHYDADGVTMNLGVTLFGQANRHLPHVAHAFEQVGRSGLTSRRIKLDLRDAQVETLAQGGGTAGETLVGDGDWNTIYESGGQFHSPVAQQLLPPPNPKAVRVRLVTPLRIRRENRLVDQRGFDFRSLAGVLLRRVSLLTTFFGDTALETDFAGLLRQTESLPITQQQLRWREWARYSSRQETKLQMGGLTGWFEVEGPGLEPFWPYLWLGQWTHAGRGCSMGLGRYVLEPAGCSEKQAANRGGMEDTGGGPQCLKKDADLTAGIEKTRWASPLRL